MKRTAIALLLALSSSPALAQDTDILARRAEEILAKAPAGSRFGVMVVDDTGREVLAVNPDQRFIPASNTKLFTTAAALDLMSADAAAVEAKAATSLSLIPGGRDGPDVVLTGGGTPLSTAADCTRRCLNGLLSGIAMKARKVGNVIADDTAFTDQRWSPGMSWNNIPTESGTAASALVVDDNEVELVVSPGKDSAPATISLSPYFAVRNEVRTVPEGETKLAYDRAVNGREVRVYGTIRADAQPWRERLGIDDPADYAGWFVKEGLAARGVKVRGKVIVRHRALRGLGSAPAAVPAVTPIVAMAVTPAPIAEEVAAINKPSQNLRAEVLLRRLGIVADGEDLFGPVTGEPGSLESGLAAVRSVLTKAGITPAAAEFSDGSGMSTYNRVSPRGAVRLLTWANTQPWAATWRASLPVGGVDGTLRRRFAETAVAGKVFAKTGTLNATNALSGYVTAASGRELTFSILANDVPADGRAVPVIDELLAAIAAAN